MAAKFPSFHFALKRWHHEIKRRHKRSNRASSREQSTQSFQQELKAKHSGFLDLFSTFKYTHPSLRPKGTVIRIKLPETFSLSYNPEKTLSIIKQVATAARKSRRPRIVLDFRPVTQMGLGADSLLGLVLNGIQAESSNEPGSYIKGYGSSSKSISEMMEEIGCVRALYDYEKPVRLHLNTTKKAFKYHKKATKIKLDYTSLDTVTRTTSNFADHLESSLKLTGKEFTKEGKQILLEYVGEILINAEEHSGRNEWMVFAYVDTTKDEPIYHSVIYSIGNSIAETFLVLDRDSFAWKVVEPYIDAHNDKKLFGDSWHRNDLLTVIALQGDISSQSNSEIHTRGNGTVDLIRFFEEMYRECKNENRPNCTMTLLSGSTSITFSEKYRMKPGDEKGGDVIAFNESNDLKKKPDSKYVKRMKNEYFPGVVLSIKVPLGLNVIKQSELKEK